MLEEETNSQDTNTEFDLIVVGSGNGACGFLSECLKYTDSADYKILVLEEGKSFFYTSDITHQNGWAKTYATTSFKVHNAKTSKGTPILSGRAVTMGGGGSINFTMIHESSQWLADKIGYDEKYWDDAKDELNHKFKRPDPFLTRTPFTKYICETFDGTYPHSKKQQQNRTEFFQPASKEDLRGGIPSLRDDYENFPGKEAKQLYVFPNQFNEYGQRTNSGVSLVDWERVHLRNNSEVKELIMEDTVCKKVKVKNLLTNKDEVFSLKEGGRVVLACGSQSPRILMGTRTLTNDRIGKRVNDHICMPLALYLAPDDQKASVSAKNAYETVFAMTTVDTVTKGGDGEVVKKLATFDFFTGEIERLFFLVSSLFLCYLPFNTVKAIMWRFPFLFTFLSNTVRILLTVLVYVYKIVQGVLNIFKGRPFGESKIVVTTALVKFNSVLEGQYEKKGDRITLKFFEDERDFTIAEEAITKNLDLLESLGSKRILISFLYRLFTRIPYKKSQVKGYVKNFSRRTLLSDQHLAGGCIFGDVIDKGITDASKTGQVIGSDNIHVADLSTVPLPRVSTQMTAYLVGHHVGKQLYAPNRKKRI